MNAEPSGQGGPGAEVQDFQIVGWMWGENVGWINLSCLNNATCGQAAFGVANDGYGLLSGFAWAENIGWINFSPTGCEPDPTCGVHIDPATGYFVGRAWSENGGWISFSRRRSSLLVERADELVPVDRFRARLRAALERDPRGRGDDGVLVGASGRGLVRRRQRQAVGPEGEPRRLHAGHAACFATKLVGTSVPIPGAPPQAGDGFWFLARGDNCRGRGTYDSGAASQSGSRDAEIAAAQFACP